MAIAYTKDETARRGMLTGWTTRFLRANGYRTSFAERFILDRKDRRMLALDVFGIGDHCAIHLDPGLSGTLYVQTCGRYELRPHFDKIWNHENTRPILQARNRIGVITWLAEWGPKQEPEIIPITFDALALSVDRALEIVNEARKEELDEIIWPAPESATEFITEPCDCPPDRECYMCREFKKPKPVGAGVTDDANRND